MPVDAQPVRRPPQLQLRHGLRLSVASVAWTVAASTAEIVLGLSHHVLTFVVFGSAGGLDAAGSAALALRFRHALLHDLGAGRHERRAALVVGAGLVLLGLLTSVASVRRLLDGHGGHGTAAGTAIASMSLPVVAALAVAKRRVGHRVGSAALVADGWLSASGAVLALLAVVAGSLGARPGLWWIDPVAALAVAAAACAYGSTVLAREWGRLRPGEGSG